MKVVAGEREEEEEEEEERKDVRMQTQYVTSVLICFLYALSEERESLIAEAVHIFCPKS